MKKISYNNLPEAIQLLFSEIANLKSMFYKSIQEPEHEIYNRKDRIKVACKILVNS
jgi:hypothetical protein